MGNPAAVRLLLAHSADVKKMSADGDTALSLAQKGNIAGHLEAARLLRQAKRPAVQSTAWAVPIKSDIKVYLDGKEMETVSPFDGQSIAPIVVEGQILIPVRFVKEHLTRELQLDREWGIIELQFGLLLKIGSKEWHGRADFGSDGLSVVTGKLPVAPHEIRGRLYMPVDPGLFQQMLFTFEWNREKRELRFSHRR
jgi:hypothetical protein